MKRPTTSTYPGGMPAVLAQMEGRRDPITAAPGEALPPLDCALAPLAGVRVADPTDDPAEAPPFRSAFHRKRYELRREFTGRSELAFLHGFLIAHLRKRAWPDHAPALFQRLWAEQAPALLDALDPRWMVSAITTFGDHGASPAQRSVGLALSTLFGTMKLYESERLYSGKGPRKPFALTDRRRADLAMEMDPYSITSGGLDVNMIGRLWQEAETDAVIAPLAHRLLNRLIEDERTVFRRLRVMRRRKARQERADGTPPKPKYPTVPVPARPRAQEADRLRWGIVATVKAPVRATLRFAAHHLELGCHALHLYLDAPAPETEAALADHPRVHVTRCDADYWASTGKARMAEHQLRQAHNATRTLRAVPDALEWLAHIDVDEFLLTDRPLAPALAAGPADAAYLRVHPAEALAPETGLPAHYKLTHKGAEVPKATLQEVYPTFGLHLYGGFLSHVSGKVFARTGIPETRLGIHALRWKGEDVANRDWLEGVHLGHWHAPSWAHFRDHFAFRRDHGSYRKRLESPEKLGLSDILALLEAEAGEAGLRTFFDEVCRDTPGLRARLAERGMLIRHPLDPDAAVARVFGAGALR